MPWLVVVLPIVMLWGRFTYLKMQGHERAARCGLANPARIDFAGWRLWFGCLVVVQLTLLVVICAIGRASVSDLWPVVEQAWACACFCLASANRPPPAATATQRHWREAIAMGAA